MDITDAAIAIDILADQFPGTAQLRRREGGLWDAGRWQEGVSTDTPLDGVVYHMPGEDIQNLPEDLRREDMRYVWTRTVLRVQTREEQEDQILYQGEVFDVLKVWERFEGSYHKVAIGRNHVRTNTV